MCRSQAREEPTSGDQIAQGSRAGLGMVEEQQAFGAPAQAASLLEGCFHRAPVLDRPLEVLDRIGVAAGLGCEQPAPLFELGRRQQALASFAERRQRYEQLS